MHCEKCDGYFCKDCIKEDMSCYNCRDATNKCSKISSFAMRHLESLQFTCPNSKKSRSKCSKTEPMTYREALEHRTRCLGENYFCPFDCVSLTFPISEEEFEIKNEVLGNDMKDHFKKCPAFKLTCTKCEMTELRYKAKSHNCIESLKKEALA